MGVHGVPIALRSGDVPDGRLTAPPLVARENVLEGCDHVIVEFTALGNTSAEARYRAMASTNATGPHWAN